MEKIFFDIMQQVRYLLEDSNIREEYKISLGFPIGCCLESSIILGNVFKKLGFGTFNYITTDILDNRCTSE